MAVLVLVLRLRRDFGGRLPEMRCRRWRIRCGGLVVRRFGGSAVLRWARLLNFRLPEIWQPEMLRRGCKNGCAVGGVGGYCGRGRQNSGCCGGGCIGGSVFGAVLGGAVVAEIQAACAAAVSA